MGWVESGDVGYIMALFPQLGDRCKKKPKYKRCEQGITLTSKIDSKREYISQLENDIFLSPLRITTLFPRPPPFRNLLYRLTHIPPSSH